MDNNEIIKITEKDGKRAVSARELHNFLGVGRDFSTWIKNRIDKYGFVEGIDYQSFPQMGEREIGGTVRIEYALSIDMAKELSMVENNERGRQARLYFIECEKQAKALSALSYQIPDPIERAKKWIEEEQERRRLLFENKEKAEKIEQDKPKVTFAEAMLDSTTSCLVGELAKILTQNGITIGQNRLFKWLRDNDYLGKRGERKNIPYQQYIEQGLFELKKSTWTDYNDVIRTATTVKVTAKGQSYFINKFLNKK